MSSCLKQGTESTVSLGHNMPEKKCILLPLTQLIFILQDRQAKCGNFIHVAIQQEKNPLYSHNVLLKSSSLFYNKQLSIFQMNHWKCLRSSPLALIFGSKHTLVQTGCDSWGFFLKIKKKKNTLAQFRLQVLFSVTCKWEREWITCISWQYHVFSTFPWFLWRESCFQYHRFGV